MGFARRYTKWGKQVMQTNQTAGRTQSPGRTGRRIFRSHREFFTFMVIIAALGFLYVWQVMQPPPKPVYACDVNGVNDPKNVELCKYAQ